MSILNLICNNPFRILGIYANTPIRERIANKNRLIAFASVGKECNFPNDISDIFGTPNRAQDCITQAEQRITLNQDKLKYSFFWFIQSSPLDKVALSNLSKGNGREKENKEKALEILNKRENFSSTINKAIIAYSESDLNTAINLTSKLIHNNYYRSELVQVVCGPTFQIDEKSTAELYINALAEELSWKKIYDLFERSGTNPQDNEYIVSNLIKEPISRIYAVISKSENIKSNSESISHACDTLIEQTEKDLLFIDEFINNDNQYRVIHDKIASTISSLSAKYFHLIDKPKDYTYLKCKRWLNKAYDIAVGDITIKNIKESLESLESARKRAEINKIIQNLIQKITNFTANKNNLFQTEQFIDEVLIDINNLTTINGHSDEIVELSSTVANITMNSIIEIVNNTQQNQNAVKQGLRDGSLQILISTAIIICSKVEQLNIDKNTRDWVLKNKTVIQSIQSTINQAQSRIKSNSGGCYIATMVYGDYDHPKVKVLRHFRDNVLAKYTIGQKFINFYYIHSPAWVVKTCNMKRLNAIIRTILNIFIWVYSLVK